LGRASSAHLRFRCGIAALQAAAAGAQLYFPMEDVSFLFVDTLRSIGRWVLSLPTHAFSSLDRQRMLETPTGVQTQGSFISRHTHKLTCVTKKKNCPGFLNARWCLKHAPAIERRAGMRG